MELSHELDPNDLKALVKDLHQGDVLDVAKSVRLYSPDTPSYPHEVEGVPHDEPVMTMEIHRAVSGTRSPKRTLKR